MEVTLINLPSPALAEPFANFPLGLGYIAAAIERRGYDVIVLDLCEEKDINNWSVPDTKSRIFGLSVTTPQFRAAQIVAKKIKQVNFKNIVVAGGPHALVAKNDFYNDSNFDSIIIEEGEFSFYELIRHFELYGKVDSVYWNPPIKLMDDIPFPARHLFPNFKKNALKTHQLLKGDYIDGGQTTIIADRYCPFSCSFCAPHPRKARYRSVKNVISEIFDIVDKFDIKQFKWQSDSATIRKKWILDLCDVLRFTGTYHRMHTRADVFDDEMASSMAIANVKIICFGIESFDQRLLDINNKGITVYQVEQSLRIAKDYGMKTVGFLIFGMPGEDEKSVEITKEFILKNKRNLDYLNLATMVPLPGTPIWENPSRFGCEILDRNYDKFWIVDHDKNDSILVKTNGITIDTMKRLKFDMYQFMRDEGYSRPEWENK
jgi:anaerobic magnesium-protoporphyrin IX monomethyl ester cyclase